jgi:hypothetical protein
MSMNDDIRLIREAEAIDGSDLTDKHYSAALRYAIAKLKLGPTKETYEDKWFRLGYRVGWSETYPRAYDVTRVEDGLDVGRFRTVKEVDMKIEWFERGR